MGVTVIPNLFRLGELCVLYQAGNRFWAGVHPEPHPRAHSKKKPEHWVSSNTNLRIYWHRRSGGNTSKQLRAYMYGTLVFPGSTARRVLWDRFATHTCEHLRYDNGGDDDGQRAALCEIGVTKIRFATYYRTRKYRAFQSAQSIRHGRDALFSRRTTFTLHPRTDDR